MLILHIKKKPNRNSYYQKYIQQHSSIKFYYVKVSIRPIYKSQTHQEGY